MLFYSAFKPFHNDHYHIFTYRNFSASRIAVSREFGLKSMIYFHESITLPRNIDFLEFILNSAMFFEILFKLIQDKTIFLIKFFKIKSFLSLNSIVITG